MPTSHLLPLFLHAQLNGLITYFQETKPTTKQQAAAIEDGVSIEIADDARPILHHGLQRLMLELPMQLLNNSRLKRSNRVARSAC